MSHPNFTHNRLEIFYVSTPHADAQLTAVDDIAPGAGAYAGPASAQKAKEQAVLLGQFGDWGAYKATPDGKVVCFFQGASKFDARYATFGFNDAANLDDGASWPVSFAIVDWVPAVEKKMAALVEAAVD